MPFQRLTRNALGQKTVAWVRLPPSAPKAAPCGVLFSVFIASFARWDSNSPCPALCVPPGCNNPVGCCKGAGTPTICTISAVESKDFTADALGGFSGATTPSSAGESKKDYIVKRPSGIMKVRSANCTNRIPGGLLNGKRYRKFAAHNMEMPVSCSICTQISQNGDIWTNQSRYWSNLKKVV